MFRLPSCVLPLTLLALATTPIACARLTPEQQLVHDAAQALGGADRVRAATGVLVLEGTGRQFNLGQDLRPGLAEQTFTVTGYSRAYDLALARLRVTQTRTPNFAYFQGPQAQTQTQGVDGDVAYNASGASAATRAPAAVAVERRVERFHHPLVLLKVALDPSTRVSNLRVAGDERLVDVETSAGPVTLGVGGDGRPVRIASPGTHPNLGDVTLTTTFGAYGDAAGLRLPGAVATRVDDFTTGEYTVTSRLEAAVDLSAPASAAGTAVPGTPAVNVTADEVAPGVWFLAGQSHHSVAVAFRDRLVLIEAPQSEARSLAAVAKAREVAPKVPLTHLVLSHHHFDHSTGLRAAIAEGLTVLTHPGNADFVKTIAARPFTRQPDALARAPKPVAVEAVDDGHVITDGARSLVLYHLAGNPHSDTMLMAYLPKERLLVEVDAFSPGGSYHPYAANLLAHVRRLKLRVDRIVPLHGAPVTLKDLEAAAGPPA